MKLVTLLLGVLLLGVFLLISCDRPTGRKSSVPDILFSVEFGSDGAEDFVRVADKFALERELNSIGPEATFTSAGDSEYAITIHGDGQFLLIVFTREGIGYIGLHCSYSLPLDQAKLQLASFAESIFHYYERHLSKSNLIKHMRLDENRSWHEQPYVGKPNFSEISDCSNLHMTVLHDSQ